MLTGTIKRFDAKTGQGFIAVEGGGADVFVHYSALAGRTLTEGQKVEFETREGKNGPEAVNVKLVQS